MSTAAVVANVSVSPVMVPLSTEVARSGEVQALSVAAANVNSKRKQTTAATSSSAAAKKNRSSGSAKGNGHHKSGCKIEVEYLRRL